MSKVKLEANDGKVLKFLKKLRYRVGEGLKHENLVSNKLEMVRVPS